MINVGILGAAGYTGGELIRVLLNHPEANIMFANCKITGNFTAGGSCTYSFVNCFINNFAQYEAATITASNCIFEGN